MPKVFTSKTQKTGEIGENMACLFLMKHGFTINERNFTKKWGEIDIIAEKDSITHFIEVKSVSHDLSNEKSVSRENIGIRPEDNMTPQKLQKFRRIVESYLASSVTHETTKPWQVDLLCVYLDQKNKKAHVKPLYNIIL